MRVLFHKDAACRILVFAFPRQLRGTPRPYIFKDIYIRSYVFSVFAVYFGLL